jgi:hypothetical protein
VLVGYVSDEQYVALADVLLEFECDGESIAVARSTPRGLVDAEVEPGCYKVTLVKPGFGSKSVNAVVEPGKPYHFRLLSDGLLGYVWPKWVKSGERAEFRVHAVEPYRLSLWRYGQQRELVRLLGWFDEHGPRASMQITPDGDYTVTGIGWNKQGYPKGHHTQFVTAPERSGLYYFHAKSESGAFFSFPWVVAPASPQARIAVLASTNTWNAYNNFGGRSNYINANQLPPRPTVNARLDLLRYSGGSFSTWQFADSDYPPLSFERPELGNHIPEAVEVTDPIEGWQAGGLAPAEWRLLGWLERERYPYDLYSEYQLHSGTLDLDAYKIVILSVHPEYWSRAMYDQVKAWVFERGGHLMYLGGNGLNCEIEFLDERTMRCKTHLSSTNGSLGMIDPDDPDIRYESRFHRTVESEANLLGVVCTETGMMTAAPYLVMEASHWIFAETGLRNGDMFGEVSLHERCHGGASGLETDKKSLHSPTNTLVLAKGLNPHNGGAEMVYYELDGGGAVFSVGSITYPACLLVDPGVSQITANVINRFLSNG